MICGVFVCRLLAAFCLIRIVSRIGEGQDGEKPHPDQEDESVEQHDAADGKTRHPGGELSQLVGYCMAAWKHRRYDKEAGDD